MYWFLGLYNEVVDTWLHLVLHMPFFRKIIFCNDVRYAPPNKKKNVYYPLIQLNLFLLKFVFLFRRVVYPVVDTGL